MLEKSERVVAAGTPLLVLGDPSRYEVVIDVLSTDAVNIRPGMRMLLTGWGGPKTLEARVRTVEPAAFTKVSALGVEEQRVNVVADFVDPPGAPGDAYRVAGHVVMWVAADVVKLPASWCSATTAVGRCSSPRTAERACGRSAPASAMPQRSKCSTASRRVRAWSSVRPMRCATAWRWSIRRSRAQGGQARRHPASTRMA